MVERWRFLRRRSVRVRRRCRRGRGWLVRRRRRYRGSGRSCRSLNGGRSGRWGLVGRRSWCRGRWRRHGSRRGCRCCRWRGRSVRGRSGCGGRRVGACRRHVARDADRGRGSLHAVGARRPLAEEVSGDHHAQVRDGWHEDVADERGRQNADRETHGHGHHERPDEGRPVACAVLARAPGSH